MLKLIRLSFLLMVLFSTSSQADVFCYVKYNSTFYGVQVDESEKTIADLKVKIAERLGINVEDFDLCDNGSTTRPDKMFNDNDSMHDIRLATRITVRLRK
ncbi:MAG: hypothetical protein Q8L85_02450 [Alphaproteobacteria bacterium]|nr:hypothetical protein [Alphaproteobacteria bacterium]